jgi:hypothetical protein
MADRRRRSRSAVLRLLLAFSLLHLVVMPNILPTDQKANPPSLAEILEKAAAYCRLFGNASLNYVCIEELRETIYIPYLRVPRPVSDHFQIRNNHFVYDYQLVKVGGKINEQRKLLEESGARKNVPGTPPRMGRIDYKYIILGPLIVNEYWQGYHDYKIMGREKVGKEECTILEAVPKPSAPAGHLYGKVWINERDGRIMKLEWYQESILNYELFVEMGAALRASPQIGLTMEYRFEKNGIGFPSRCRISEDYITNEGGFRLTLSETTITYRNYKFFTVETEVRTHNQH